MDDAAESSSLPAPVGTYRLQLGPDLSFDDAAALVPYLAALGVSHAYLSPILQAAPGSTHGYDVIDHSRLSDELGGEAAYRRLCAALAQAGMSQVVDVVPNHMAAISENDWWWDVLENGPSSVEADTFDIDWGDPERDPNLVLVPVLGDHYGRIVDGLELQLARRGGRIEVHYHEHRFPLAPRSLGGLLHAAAARATRARTEVDEARANLLGFFGDACGSLPGSWRTDEQGVTRRHRDKEVIAALMRSAFDADPGLASTVDAELAAINRDPVALDRLLDRQNYRLAHWQSGAYELDYRRFFDITTLVGLRMDRRSIFDRTHELLLRLVAEGCIDGLRIDHPDGLRDPAGYLQWLAERAPGHWIVVEKILAFGERLPSWPVSGTTGYEFAAIAGGTMIDPAGEAALTALHQEITGDGRSWPEHRLDAKRHVLRRMLAADLSRLTALFLQVCDQERAWRDYPPPVLRRGLEEALLSFPVYRTYVAEGQPVAPTDEALIRAALHEAASHPTGTSVTVPQELYTFLGDVLLLRVGGEAAAELAARFQQLTAPVMAKGIEDTAGYRYSRLGPLGEVGADPGTFGVAVDALHDHNRHVAEHWPTTMVATSTHDTKRSEDVRARLSVVSERADEWADVVRRWRARPVPYRSELVDGWAEKFFYELAVGAHPLPAARAEAVMTKAMREAKLATSWLDPHPDYEEAVLAFVRGCCADAPFQAELDAFVAPMVVPGRVVSLALLLLTCTSPGVPDRYQGTEVWDDSLVDPDNRRAVDFAHRAELLERCRRLADEQTGDGTVPAALLDVADDTGIAKLHTLRTALAVRRRRPRAFGPSGGYLPLHAEGPAAAHVIAYCRGGDVITVVPRLLWGLQRRADAGAGWAGTTLSIPTTSHRWRNALTGEVLQGGHVPVATLLGRFPVALLVADAPGGRRRMMAARLGVWAPTAESVGVVLDGEPAAPMQRDPHRSGWWTWPHAHAGRYAFVLDGAVHPDPRSPDQPDGPDGASNTVDHDAYPWQDRLWHGRPLASTVIYELHVGTFSAAGTFSGVEDHLDHLVDLGVGAIELLPVNSFPGRWGWGYDGVAWYAPQRSYGTPDDLKHLVDACHAKGLAVLIDAVYNHVGPAGNHLWAFGPYFTDRHHTPWGQALNVDGPDSDEVRRFVIDNALMWLRDYHADGLRLDAVHAIVDHSATHVLEELAAEVDRLAVATDRTLWLIAESEANDPRLVRSREAHGYGLDGQWSDDLHHAVHVALTGERDGYYADYTGLEHVAKAWRDVFVRDGSHSPSLRRRHGRPVGALPARRFVTALQNHDQIGNRATGDRIGAIAGLTRQRIGAVLTLLAPTVPLLFQGEEWAASSPFQFFTDHTDPELAEAIRTGRRSEFAAFGWRPEDVPDPQAPGTFTASKLRWDEVREADHAEMLAWYRALLRLRRLNPIEATDVDVTAVDAHHLIARSGHLAVAVHLGDGALTTPIPDGRHLLLAAGDVTVDGSSVTLASDAVVVFGPA